jgi:hypothetical protein
LDRNVGETEVDQTDANPGTDYKDICWQDGRRIVELKTLAEQINACDGCDTPLNLMNIEQERLHGFGSYVSIRCTTIAILFHLFQKFYLFVEYGLFSGFFMNKFACRKKMTIDIFLLFCHDILAMILFGCNYLLPF